MGEGGRPKKREGWAGRPPRKETYWPVIAVRCDGPFKEWVLKVADCQGITMSDLVTSAVADYAARNGVDATVGPPPGRFIPEAGPQACRWQPGAPRDVKAAAEGAAKTGQPEPADPGPAAGGDEGSAAWAFRGMGGTMRGPYTINLEALYDDDALCDVLGLRRYRLEVARKAGYLRFTRRGGKILYLGAWVQDWLTRDEAEQVAEVAIP